MATSDHAPGRRSRRRRRKPDRVRDGGRAGRGAHRCQRGELPAPPATGCAATRQPGRLGARQLGWDCSSWCSSARPPPPSRPRWCIGSNRTPRAAESRASRPSPTAGSDPTDSGSCPSNTSAGCWPSAAAWRWVARGLRSRWAGPRRSSSPPSPGATSRTCASWSPAAPRPGLPPHSTRRSPVACSYSKSSSSGSIRAPRSPPSSRPRPDSPPPT